MTLDKKTMKREGERGNALFLILIAVALFAALSYAITQSGRGGGNVSSQTALITAGQLTEEPADVRAAVARMILSGTGVYSPITSDAADGTPTTNVFDQTGQGGGATNVPPPAGACNTAAECASWTYSWPTSSTAGNYVFGVGTTAPEALAYLANITQPVCIAINKGLALPGVTQALLETDAQKTANFTGVAGAYTVAGGADTIESAVSADLSGQDFACWNNVVGGDTSTYWYYASLMDN